ncbi:hypothetical protein H257_03539 [Aphanomyces astaci]|uniref:Oxidation resistance protein 1 n=1 Tax=Aphanomyces astaci TaxID=112090 RepID=W4GX83_APHAT|nr:hypothetical protein H257_03539 [Aphanomyces astaci]ETV84287.1 hypothetical protein H257_03539 [Aphanomyces astaci]|eukprot:XP_009825979.1 hypothetical protein H257_03539 [Aphanomyces astaci]
MQQQAQAATALRSSQHRASLPTPPAEDVTSTTQGPRFKYVVQEGDTIAGIALRHGMREYDLRHLNHLFGSNIYKGQELVLRVKIRSNSVPTSTIHDSITSAAPTSAATARRLNQGRSGGGISEESPSTPTISRQPSSNQQDDASITSNNNNNTPPILMKVKAVPPAQPESQPKHSKPLMEVTSIPQLHNATSMDILPDPVIFKSLVPKLEACLPPQYRGYDWAVAYSLAQHGASLDTLYRKVYHRRASLVVVETGDGDIFGAFAASPWAVSNSFYGTGECFVFTCYPKFEHFPWKGHNAMFMFSNDSMLAMGGGGGFAFGLNADLSRGTSARCLTFENRCLTKRSEFDVVNCEVWEFVPKV